jgi:hypothetical protein
MKSVYLFFFLLYFLTGHSQKTQLSFSVTNAPVVFGPGIISNGLDNRDMTISPANDELYYTLQHKSGSVILHCKKNGVNWSKPEVAWFSGKFSDLEPAFSPDGNKLFFTSSRPLTTNDSAGKDYDIWYVEKQEGKWSGPFHAGPAINTARDEYYPSVAANGNLYFTRDNGETKDDIFISAYGNGVYADPLPLPNDVNSAGYDFNAFIDPGERFIIFSSYKRKDDLGGGDLYISKRQDGVWQTPVHAGNEINSPALDYSPFVSFDRRYFFFTSKRSSIKFPFKKKKNLAELQQLFLSPGNGSDDIYMMSLESILRLIK